MSNFLDNLKKAVENGEFNSDVAKKINELDSLADKVPLSGKELESAYIERLTASGVRSVSEDEAKASNIEHDEKMATIKKQEAMYCEIKTLIEIEDLISLSIADMFDHVKEVKERILVDAPENQDLADKIKEIELKYSSFINN